MFYTHILLGKHGVLSKIWIAAHWHKKLTRRNISECDLETAIQRILSPKMVISLRISGHLLLGVVRVFHRKTKYLLTDCNEALLKMRLTFRPGALDLSAEDQEATYNAITLQEEFHDFDVQLPDLNRIDVVDHFTLNQSRVEDITMRDDYSRQLHDSFGELDPMRQDIPKEHSFEVSSSSFLPEHSSMTVNEDRADFLSHDCFGDEGAATDFFADNQLFGESNDLGIDVTNEVTLPAELPEEQHLEASSGESDPTPTANAEIENTTLLNNEEEGFILDPVDVTEIEKRKRTKKKRKLMVDPLKEISGSSFREQLADPEDTLSSPDIAPKTRSMMEWKITDGVQWLLSQPCQPMINTDLQSLFIRNQRPVATRRPQEEPAEPEVEVVRHAQEEQDPLPLEVSEMTDGSSAYAEQSSGIHEISDINQPLAQEATSGPEERIDLMESSIAVPLPEENQELTGSMQDSEELQRNKKTQEMLQTLRRMNQSGINSFSLQQLCKNDKRKQVSAKFYSMLVLKKQSAIQMVQSAPYSDIIATPGPRFHSL